MRGYFRSLSNLVQTNLLGRGTTGRILFFCGLFLQILNTTGFKTGLERGLICNQCIGTHPGCSIFNYNWHWGVECGRRFDKCVKLIERRGSDTLITRDCLSNLEAFRVDIPADKYEGCHAASSDPKLGVYVQNSIPELDIKRRYYSNVTWCFCSFDHWCNSSRPFSSSIVLILVALNSTLMT